MPRFRGWSKVGEHAWTDGQRTVSVIYEPLPNDEKQWFVRLQDASRTQFIPKRGKHSAIRTARHYVRMHPVGQPERHTQSVFDQLLEGVNL